MKRLSIQLYRAFSTTVNKQTTVAKPVDPLKNVIGLTSKCVQNNDAKAVNGTGKEYKVPEYFGFNRMSYSEAEVEMEKFRIAQPIAPRK
ncbi:unnamed protein product [Chironomus riparius]|uniref:NADH-ubiquinone oxidoreductase 9 kDa subunit n=1 Tax=Chironomus riparius TaxID=315576 RepID=A0A9N9WTU4_9DIPT|nr:unnamed protein product [Chironomus riparius]